MLVALLVVAATTPWLLAVTSRLTAFLLACFVAQCAYGAAAAVVAGYRLLSAVFWTFSLCYLAIPAAYQVSTHQAAWGDDFIYYDQTRVLETLVITNLSFALFGIGTLRKRRRPRPSPPSSPRTARSLPPEPAAPALAIARQRRSYVRPRRTGRLGRFAQRRVAVPTLYCLLALALLPLVASRLGGVGSLLSSRSEHGQALEAAGIGTAQSGGAAVALVAILPGALALAATFVLALRWRNGDRRGPVVLVLSAGLLFLYSNPFANTRYVSSVAVVSIVLVVLQPRLRRSVGVVVLLLVIGILGVYPLANAFRGPGEPVQPVSLASNDFDGFQQLVNTRQYVEEQGHTNGIHLASAALFIVPRSFWSDKAEPASIPVARNRGYTFTNLSLPLPGELYLEFGVIGGGACMFLWGRGWRRLDEAWAAGTSTVAGTLVAYLAIAQVGFLRGPVLSMFPIYASAIFFIVVALGIERRGVFPSARRAR